jgi:hypothetical protein
VVAFVDRRIAQLFPPEIRDALVHAAARHDHKRIDALTDNLTRRGYTRARQCIARIDEWQARRPALDLSEAPAP